MIAGGTGITPMYQALELLANTPGDDTEVTLLYGNASTEDILMQKELERLEKVADGRLKVGQTCSHPTVHCCFDTGIRMLLC